MISVDAALAHVLDLADLTSPEDIDLRHAANRVLAGDIVATRAQPPFAASAMDGYAIAGEAGEGSTFRVIGESAAGTAFPGSVGAGEAARIFTGAPVPKGATRVVIQEDVTREGDVITVAAHAETQTYIRAAGQDFAAGDRIEAGQRLTPAIIALAASMGAARVRVSRRPVVALIATGNELVAPGETPTPDQIIASNTYGIAAALEAEGAEARILPIARDTRASLAFAFDLATSADLIVTSGGASVGDHDLVGPVAAALGMEQSFYKVAMRPGKPLMAGKLSDAAMIGLPGNSVSAMVCGAVFVAPLLRKMMGLPPERPVLHAPLATALPQNGPRAHYMRATWRDGGLAAADSQDSSLLTVLARADALLIRPPNDPAREAGDMVDYMPI